MGSYGDYGYGFEDNYGYGKSDYRRGGGRSSWQQGNGSRKRRGNYDQMQQFEQRRGRRWRGNQGGWGDNEEWYGDDSYDDSYQGGWQEDDYGYNDGYGNSRKRGRFYDDDPRGGRYMERGPHSVNFYDDYDDSYNRRSYHRGRSWHGDSRRGHRSTRYYEEESEWSGHYDRRGDSSHSYYSRERDSTRRPFKPIRRKSDAEDAVYEKHKKVTVERGKRDRISNTVHSVITVFREVALTIAQEEHERKNSNNVKEEQETNEEEETNNSESTEIEAKDSAELASTDNVELEETCEDEEKTNNSESTETEAKDSTELASTDNAELEETKDDASVSEETKAETTELSPIENVEAENTVSTDESKDDVEKTSESNNLNSQENKNNENSAVEKPATPNYEPVVLSAIKCGESAMRILVGDSLQASVVVITKKKPTRSLVDRIQVLLEEQLKVDKRMKSENFTLEFDEEQESLILKQDSVERFHVIIRFTSPECSPDDEAKEEEQQEEDPEDVLSPESCLKALVQLRRMRFFVKKLDSSPISLTVVRILLFFRTKLEGWDKIPVWLTLLLVYAARVTILGEDKPDPDQEKENCRVDTLLLRCLEILSSGVLLPGSPGMKDPCEVGKDAGEDLSDQECFVITTSAQRVLRQVYFGKIRSLLDVDA